MLTKATKQTCMVAFGAFVVLACEAPAPQSPMPASSRPAHPDTGARDRLFATAFQDSAGGTTTADSASDPGATPGSRVVLRDGASTRAGHGRAVTIDVVQAPLSEVIRLLADVGNVNVVVDESVASSRVTVKLRHVPWDEALEAVVASKGLALERTGRVYVVRPQKPKI